ncbi:MAG: tRNA 2-thiouridine(34) synthase MnmA, partial [Corynebacterium flavescens]|nr:tRNA 2-thiouridine(34) synthase MnmA [Corynebacterium flavescens]
VIGDFVDSYARGETPNPCLRCNEKIKFRALLQKGMALGFDAVATGHYATIDSEGYMRRSLDENKDQSYVLGVISAEELRHCFFPIGDTPKPQIREEAARHGFSTAKKPDSYDICFIPDGNTQAFLGSRIGLRPGMIVDQDGHELKEHDGAWNYTIGQRKGLDIKAPASDGRPRYVTDIDAASGTVTVGAREDLAVTFIEADRLKFLHPAMDGEFSCEVQVRAHGSVVACRARVDRDNDTMSLELEGPLSGVARGQAAVLYLPSDDALGDVVLGSGTICATR